jgi:3',5'-cyclic AMP phosphodiesterase CpdA
LKTKRLDSNKIKNSIRERREKLSVNKAKGRSKNGFIEVEESNYKGGKLSKIVIESIIPYIKRLNEHGVKYVIAKVVPGSDLDYVAINQVKRFLSVRRSIKLGKGLGRVYVQYRRGGVRIELSGFIRSVIKMITITDRQILDIFNDILDQIQDKYVKNPEYIINKIDNIIADLSNSGIYKPETSEEKTLYDLVLLILLNHYKLIDDIPLWIEPALYNLKQAEFIEQWVESFITYISSILLNISENIFLNFKVTFDSVLLRTLLNRKTNKGQISKLLKVLDINIDTLVSNFTKNYVSPSFLRDMGEILGNLVSSALSEVSKKEENNINKNNINELTGESNFINLTMTFGENPFTQRRLRWYTKGYSDYRFIEYSSDKNFKNSFKAESECIPVSVPKPILNLGIVSTYSEDVMHKYSVKLDNLCENTKYYYRICDVNGSAIGETYNFTTKFSYKNFKFIVLADSQGMTKYDYDIFINVFKEAVDKIPDSDFILHLGDFVDDGNNENYWRWILDSKLWAKNAVVPLIGNHESKKGNFPGSGFVENPISRHFYIEDLFSNKTSKEVYYSYVYNNCIFIVLDTNDLSGNGELNKQQYKWALKIAKTAKTKWKILVAHKPPYSNGPHHSDPDVYETGKQIINIAYEAEVDLVIGGHDHVYVRTPALAKNEECKCKRKTIVRGKISYDTFIDPDGTLFIVPGTSGVKNYKQNKYVTIPVEKILDIKKPIYSSVEVTDNVIYYTSYVYNSDENTSEVIDSFAIEKNILSHRSIDSCGVIRMIDNIPQDSHEVVHERIEKAIKYYKSLEYDEKVKVINYNKLLFFSKILECNQKIPGGDIITVKTKKEFINAVKNKKIKTIIANCEEIKFENIFGRNSRCVISRDLCIRGNAKLSFVNFIVKNGATLILDDTLCIDNSRRIFSLYFSLNTIELYDNCNLIVNNKVSINNSYGIGKKGYSIFIKGVGTNVYLNSVSQSYSSGGFLCSDKFDTRVVVNDGSYETSGGKYAFNVKGQIKINKGYVGSIKVLHNSSAVINGGVIGQENKLSASVPIECEDGTITIAGGTINTRDGVSIYGHGENTEILIKPGHDGSVIIDKKIFYLGNIEYYGENLLKIILPDKLLRKNYGKIYLCSFSYEEYLMDSYESSRIISELDASSQDAFHFEANSSNCGVFMKARYLENACIKPILLINGAKCYISSKNKML